MSLDLSRIRIVLVDPKVPENVGMTARAMMNCGLSRLALVRPSDHRSPAAVRPAMEAYTLVESAEVHPDLDSALTGSKMVAGTTRRTGQDRHPLLTPAEWIRDFLPRARGSEVSILFGTEKDGLSREAVDRCDVLIGIPAHAGYPSFNLAQAVLLVAYELFRASQDVPPAASPMELADQKQREEFYRHLEDVLLRIGFLYENNPGRIMGSLRRLFGRTGLEEREVRILRGILSQVDWALKSARDSDPHRGR
ncbi:MAG TPA: RNA methyltransferase [Candidatus Polarisedimenticolia bacterium]|nr:RNA methyltransferase [Candidatus Polarisedimenticolia bacterium]